MFLPLIFASLIVIAFLIIELTQKPQHSFFFRGLASFAFILVWAISTLKRGIIIEYPILILLGLIIGLVADLNFALKPLTLEEEKENTIFRGLSLLTFSLFFYLLSILSLTTFSFYALIFAIVITLIYTLTTKKNNKLPKNHYIPLFLGVSFFMVGQSFHFAINSNFNNLSLTLVFGLSLFTLNFILIILNNFCLKSSKVFTALNLTIYYIAQILIASSILFL